MKALFVLVLMLGLALPCAPALARPASVDATSTAACGARKRRGRRRRRKPRPTKKTNAQPANSPAKSDAAKAGPGGEEAPDAGDADLTGLDESKGSGTAAPQAGGGLRRSNRMEFDARLVKGQTATSGAVYLFQRAPRKLPPLLKMHQSYLDRIVEPIFGKTDDKE